MTPASRLTLALAATILLLAVWPAAGMAACANPVACENEKPGSAPSAWQVSGAGDSTIQGYATSMSVNKGGTIRFKVKSDTTDEIHFHGYDKHQDVKAGGQVVFDVPATIEGRFVVELEDHKTQIAEVEVDPS
jgi:hypothetical protein